MTFPISDTHSPRGPPPDRQQSYKYYAAKASHSRSPSYTHSHQSRQSPSFASSHARGDSGQSARSDGSTVSDVEQGRNGPTASVARQEVEDDGGWTVDWETPTFVQVGGQMKRTKNRGLRESVYGTASFDTAQTTHSTSYTAHHQPEPEQSIKAQPAFKNENSSANPAWEDIADTPHQQVTPLPLSGDLQKEDGGWTIDASEETAPALASTEKQNIREWNLRDEVRSANPTAAVSPERAAGDDHDVDGGWVVDGPSTFPGSHPASSPLGPERTTGESVEDYSRIQHGSHMLMAVQANSEVERAKTPVHLDAPRDNKVSDAADGGWTVDDTPTVRPSQVVHRQVEGGEEGAGWSRNDEASSPPATHPPRQVRTIPSASAAIRNWLGSTIASPHPDHDPHQGQGHGSQYIAPIEGSMPPHVRHASMRDPNRDPIANTRTWGAASPVEQHQTDLAIPFSALHTTAIQPSKRHATPTFGKGDDYGKDDGIATPALTFSPFSPTGVPEFDKLDLKQAADANAAAAAATAAAAIKSGGNAAGNAGAGDDDGGWSSDAAVKRWAQSVDATLPPPPEPIIESDPEEPPKRRSPSVSLTIKTEREEVPSRPSSVAPRPPPITQYISDDESEDDSPLPTPKIGDRFDQPRESPTVVKARREDQHQTLPYHADARTEFKTASAFGDSETTETRRDRQYRSQRQHRERDKSNVYWKRDPHPAFSPKYAAHRVLVNVRIPNLVTMLTDHMSRYGSIRMIWTIEAKGDGADTALAIFDDPESVAIFMASKDRNICISRSSNRAGTTEFSIETSIPPSTLTAKTVYIKVTGERGDGRSRSASPSLERSQSAKADQRDFRMRPLPLGVHIDAVPQINRRKGNIEYYARIRPAHLKLENVQHRALYETNQSARELFYVDLGRRVQEKDFIPRLADYFAEIVDVVPPRNKDQGWLIAVGGTGYARALMSEMSKISGITVRWARRDDEHEQQDGGDAPSEALGVEASPSSRYGELAADVEQHNGGRRLPETGSEESLSALDPRPESNEPVSIAARLEAQVDESGWPVRSDTPSVPTIKLDNEGALSTSNEHRAEPPVDADEPHLETFAGGGAAGNVQTGQSSNDNAQAGNAPPGNPGPSQQHGAIPQQSNGNDGNDDPRQPFGGGGQRQGQGHGGAYPSFTRRLEYTYRGRILRMDDSGAVPRYYDDAGVFVGRLCQSREDRHTLFARFSKYGFICDIEYKVVSTTAYGSARILFGDVASAQRALRYEMGETDYGSVLKIDKRRVLPADVEMRECMIDDFGRAYSPAMAEQWSPPHPHGHHLGATVSPEFPRPAQATHNGSAVPHDHAIHGRSPLSLQLSMPNVLPNAGMPPMQGQWSGVLQPAAANGPDAIHQISLELGVRYWPGGGAPPPLQPGPMMLLSPPGTHAVPVSPVPPVPSHVQQDTMAAPITPVSPRHQQQDTLGARSDVAPWPLTQATPTPTDSRTPHRQVKAQLSTPDRGEGGPKHGTMEQAAPITAPQPNTADAGPLSAPFLVAQRTEDPDSAATRSTVATAGSAEPVFPRLPSPERKTRRDHEGDTDRAPSFPRTTSPVGRSGAGSLNSSTSSAHGSQNGLEVKDKFVTASGLHKYWYDPDQLAAFRAENGLPPIAVPGHSRDTTVTPATAQQQTGHVDPAYTQGTARQHPTPQSQSQMQYVDPDAQVAITPSRPFASLSASSSSRSHSSNHSVDHPYQLEAPPRPFQQARTTAVPIPFVEQMPLARPPTGVAGHAAHAPTQAGQNSFAQVPPFELPMMQPPYVPSHDHLAQQDHRGPPHNGVPPPGPLQPPYAPIQTNQSPDQAYTPGMMPPSHPGWLSSANNSKPVGGMGRSWGSRSAGGMNGNGGRYERYQMPHHRQQQDQRQHYQQQDHQHHSAQDPPSVPPGFEQS